jgi:flagellar biosynthesis/type III secretory pathway protein FliH
MLAPVEVGESPDNAYERGYGDGLRDGRRDAGAMVEATAGGLRDALEASASHLAELRLVQAEALVGTAIEIAEAVLGAAPPVDRAVLTERLRRALTALDDDPLTVYLHPGDREVFGEALTARFGVVTADDPSLAPGEARVAGPWARADLTREAALSVIREALA